MPTIGRRLNLADTPCPTDFVLVKRELDALLPGECLEVRLESIQSAREMAESLTGLGYDVVSIQESAPGGVLVLRRRNSSTVGFAVRQRPRKGGCNKANRRHNR